MGTYRPLYTLRVEHDYYDGNKCRCLTLRPSPSGAELCRRRGIIFRQTDINEWSLLYDTTGPGADTSSDKIEAGLFVTDPYFTIYTDMAPLASGSPRILRLPASDDILEAVDAIQESSGKRHIGSPFCHVTISITDNIISAARNGTPVTCTLRFRAPRYKWEYLLVPHTEDTIAPDRCIMEEADGRIMFLPFKTIRAYGTDALHTMTQEAVPMKEHYTYRLRALTLCGVSEKRQLLLGHIPPPEPGKFMDAGPGILRQICYL